MCIFLYLLIHIHVHAHTNTHINTFTHTNTTHTQPQHEATTGLMFAALYGRDEVVHLLLASGADPNIQDIVSGE